MAVGKELLEYLRQLGERAAFFSLYGHVLWLRLQLQELPVGPRQTPGQGNPGRQKQHIRRWRTRALGKRPQATASG
jgi:hypothetical protein